MFCSSCGQQTVEGVRYCTKCGNELVERRPTNGFRHAAVLFALGLILIPVWMFIGAAFPPNDRFVESSPSTTWPEMIAWIAMWVFFVAALARIGYAAIFELTQGRRSEPPQSAPSQLNAGDNFRPAQGAWRETTTDLFEPAYKPQRNSGEL